MHVEGLGVEKPKHAGRIAVGHGLAQTGRSGEVTPFDLDLEAPVAEAKNIGRALASLGAGGGGKTDEDKGEG